MKKCASAKEFAAAETGELKVLTSLRGKRIARHPGENFAAMATRLAKTPTAILRVVTDVKAAAMDAAENAQ